MTGQRAVGRFERVAKGAYRGDRILTASHAAKALGCSANVVKRWADAGLIRSHCFPMTMRARRFRWSDVVAFAQRYPGMEPVVRAFADRHGLSMEPQPISGVLTTGEAAAYLGVSARQVASWVSNGVLEGYRLPTYDGRPGDRRITADALRRFVARHRIDVEAIRDEAGRDGEP